MCPPKSSSAYGAGIDSPSMRISPQPLPLVAVLRCSEANAHSVVSLQHIQPGNSNNHVHCDVPRACLRSTASCLSLLAIASDLRGPFHYGLTCCLQRFATTQAFFWVDEDNNSGFLRTFTFSGPRQIGCFVCFSLTLHHHTSIVHTPGSVPPTAAALSVIGTTAAVYVPVSLGASTLGASPYQALLRHATSL